MITELKNVTNATEALEQAGLNWTVDVNPLQLVLPNGETKVLKEYRSVTRDSQVLGIVGGRYKAVNNAEIFNVADSVIAGMGGFYTQAMTFQDGKRVALQVKLPNTLNLGRDEVSRYLTFINSFDGSIALRVFITPIRIWCQNMVRLALSKAIDSVTIRHSSTALVRLNEVEKVLSTMSKYHKQFDQVAGTLFNTKFSAKQMHQLSEQLIPVVQRENTKGELIIDSTRAANNRSRLVQLFETGKGHVETGIVGTAWGAFNAVAEYVDHERGTRTKEGEDPLTKRVESAWFGSGSIMKNKAFELIRAEVGV